MPNHVTHICTVTGPEGDVDTFSQKHFPESDEKSGDRSFDFSTIIERPKSIQETQSSSESELMFWALTGLTTDAVAGHRNGFALGAPHLPKGLHTRDEVLTWARTQPPRKSFGEGDPVERTLIETGLAAVRAWAETGFADWYEWSIAKWGTKWGAYDYEFREASSGRFVFKFETAWSFPEPIFRKLAQMYPTLVFHLVSYDEGSNFACLGEFNGKNDFETVEATPELYERVYGHPEEREDEEEAVGA